MDISAINGTAIAGHQGPETITDLTIRTLLTLPSEFVPHEIVSLMRYPGSPRTRASRRRCKPHSPHVSPGYRHHDTQPGGCRAAAHSARTGRTAPSPLVTTSILSAPQWNQLMTRVGTLPMPTVATKPSSKRYRTPSPTKPDHRVGGLVLVIEVFWGCWGHRLCVEQTRARRWDCLIVNGGSAWSNRRG